jgi:hypothetical protein
MLYDNNSEEIFKKHDLFYQLDKEWVFVNEIEEADIVPILPVGGPINKNLKIRLRDDQILLVCHWYIIDEHYDLDYYQRLINDKSHLAKNILVVQKNYDIVGQENIIFYDSMFNLAKLCFTEFDKYDLYEREWHFYTSQETYKLNDIDKSPVRKFIYPSYVYEPYNHPRIKYRVLLRDVLKNRVPEGFVSSDTEKLLPNEPISHNMLDILNSNTPQWYPINDQIYNSSYVSIITESITGVNNIIRDFNQVRCVTEKTFEPLIKGNFILPFGYKGLIKDVLEYGFKLPDWIDYSYDSIDDADERFSKFVASIQNMLDYSVEQLHELYLKDKHILEHNRKIFVDRSYDNLYNKIKEFKNKMPR